MKIRTVYFKVADMSAARDFWQALLGIKAHKVGERYSEIRVENINLGFVLKDSDDKFEGANCVPVFEFADDELPHYIEKAKSLKANLIIDGLGDPNLQSVVMSDLWGNEFELCKFHD